MAPNATEKRAAALAATAVVLALAFSSAAAVAAAQTTTTARPFPTRLGHLLRFVLCNSTQEDFFCVDDSKCIPKAKVCDGHVDCTGGADERGCEARNDCPESDYFRCKNGDCISRFWKCDAEADCADASDEADCGNATHTCEPNEFQCVEHGLCIPHNWKCDGEPDCTDASDESTATCIWNAADDEEEGGTTTTTERPCAGFKCRDDGRCIPNKWRCDKERDCLDDSDEDDCDVDHQGECDESLGWLSCDNGERCVADTHVCDGIPHCDDRADEGPFCADKTLCPSGGSHCEQLCKKSSVGEECYCRAGFRVSSADLTRCEDVNECEEYGSCSQDCENTPGSFMCTCREHYTMELSSNQCKVFNDPPLLFFSTRSEIRMLEIPRVGPTVERDITPVPFATPEENKTSDAVRHAIGVAYDGLTSRVYWSSVMTGHEGINSADLDGRNPKTVVPAGQLGLPEDVAADHISRNLYFTDSKLKIVGVASMRTGAWAPLPHLHAGDSVDKPRGIAVYPEKSMIFYTDWGDNARIIRADTDGSHAFAIVSSPNVAWPNGVAVDKALDRVFWSDAKLNQLASVRLDGSDMRLVPAEFVFHPFSVAVFEDTLYWSDWQTHELVSCNKFTGKNVTTLVKKPHVFPMGVSVFHDLEQVGGGVGANPCARALCSHVCVVRASGDFRCLCPTGMELRGNKCVNLTTTTTSTTTALPPMGRSFDSDDQKSTTAVPNSGNSTTTQAGWVELGGRLYKAADLPKADQNLGLPDTTSTTPATPTEDQDSIEPHDAPQKTKLEPASGGDSGNWSSDDLVIAIVVLVVLVLAIAGCIYCCLVRKGDKKASNSDEEGNGERNVHFHFKNPTFFGRGRLLSGGEELKSVTTDAELNNAMGAAGGAGVGTMSSTTTGFSVAPLHASASNRDLYGGSKNDTWDQRIRRSATNPHLDQDHSSTSSATPASTPSMQGVPGASNASNVNGSAGGGAGGAIKKVFRRTKPANKDNHRQSSSMDDEYEDDDFASGDYGDNVRLIG